MPWWLICYVSAVVAAMVIATVQSVFCLDAAAWASWVQAIGSIAAIGATGWLFLAQRASEQKREADAELARKLTAARRAQAVTFWAVEAIGRGAESRDGGGPDMGLPFRVERLDHLRQMLERIAETAEDNASSVALLAVCRNLNEAYVTYTQLPGIYREIEIKALYSLKTDTQQLLDRLIEYQMGLEGEANSRGLSIAQVSYS